MKNFYQLLRIIAFSTFHPVIAGTKDSFGSGSRPGLPLYLKKLMRSCTGAMLITAGTFSAAHSQVLPGYSDPGFNAADVVANTGGFDNYVHSIVLQPDGKMLAGGFFNSYNGSSRNRITRLNADGSLDSSFNPGTGFNDPVWPIALQPDGKIVAGGFFTSFNGASRNRIARLNPDGSLGSSFNPGTGFNGPVTTLALQPDGKVIVSGYFGSFNGTACSTIARLNTDGTLDNSFNPGTGFINGTGQSIALLNDGRMVVGGNFTAYNGTARNRIIRLHADGSPDESFQPGTGFNVSVLAVVLQPDGKMVAGGEFTTYNGTARSNIARLNTDGSLDNSFNPGDGFTGTVRSITLQPDGKIIAGGDFGSYNGTPRNRITRLHSDASLDNFFNPGAGFDNHVNTIALQPDGKIVVGGIFTSFDGIIRNRIARLYIGEGSQLSADKDRQAGPEVFMYPNPTSGDMNLVFDGLNTRAAEVVLYNNLGQPVLQQAISPEQTQAGVKLPTAHLAAGVYYLKLRWDGKTTSKQIVLQR